MLNLAVGHVRHALGAGIPAILSLLLTSCGGSQVDPNTASAAGNTETGSGAGATDCTGPTPCPKLPPQCQRYLSQACEAVGQGSSACKHLRNAAPLLPPEACGTALEHLDYTRQSAASVQSSCELLTQKLCSALGSETETCQLVREKAAEFSDDRCQVLLEDHYEELLADLQHQESANKPLTAEKWATVSAADAPSFGPATARVVLVEFSDFQCPYCARAAEVAQKVREEFGDKVRFVFRQFPLQFHEHAPLAAQAALAAHAQGKFWEYHDALFEHQDQLARENLDTLAANLGLDLKAFTTALNDGTYKAAVDSDYALGESLPVLGTPTLFLNGARVENPTDFGEVSDLIEQKLAE